MTDVYIMNENIFASNHYFKVVYEVHTLYFFDSNVGNFSINNIITV